MTNRKKTLKKRGGVGFLSSIFGNKPDPTKPLTLLPILKNFLKDILPYVIDPNSIEAINTFNNAVYDDKDENVQFNTAVNNFKNVISQINFGRPTMQRETPINEPNELQRETPIDPNTVGGKRRKKTRGRR